MLYAVAFSALLAVANAQSAPDWRLIPRACATDCARTIETSYVSPSISLGGTQKLTSSSYLCQNQFNGGTAIYGCFCESFPSDAAGCATCLTNNNAAALGQLLTGTQTDCGAQQQNCAFACAFDTCASSDIACQCSDTYLSAIFNCASCNEANNREGTRLADFTALKDSCGAQNFTGASQSFVTWVNRPTGTENYAAPELTATGGGEAATGTFAPASEQAPTSGGAAPTQAPGAGAGAGASPSGASAAPTAGAGAGASAPSASRPAATGAAGGASPSGAAPAASAPAAGAERMAVPAVFVAAIAGVAALL